LSRLITLRPGDLIYSGTPAGVGPVKRGDKLEGHVDGVGDLTITYATR
jgi:fumarylpyruvate hydrolase